MIRNLIENRPLTEKCPAHRSRFVVRKLGEAIGIYPESRVPDIFAEDYARFKKQLSN